MNKSVKAIGQPEAALPESVAQDQAVVDGEPELAIQLRNCLLESLTDAGIEGAGRQAAHLAGITGRAYQSSRRWIDPVAPGLPDLTSFRRICQGMDGDPNWMLGFIDDRRSLREAMQAEHGPSRTMEKRDDRLAELMGEVQLLLAGRHARRMHGDEMAPDIRDGDMMFIDFDAREFVGNGIYLVTCDGMELVRSLEYRMGTGLVLRCSNARYEETIVQGAHESRRRRLKVLGRVEGVFQVHEFWRERAPLSDAPSE